MRTATIGSTGLGSCRGRRDKSRSGSAVPARPRSIAPPREDGKQRPLLVSDVDADGIAAMYVTSDLGPHLDDAAAAARRLHVPTISKEMACVQSSRCMLAFSSQPAVEIVLNHDAATSAGVHFNQAFRMLVREQ